MFNDGQCARLTIKESDWSAFRQHLHQKDGMERAAFMLLGSLEEEETLQFYVHQLRLVPDQNCVQQHATIVEPDSWTVLDNFQAFQKSDTIAFLHAHSHPFTNCAVFSSVDDAYLPEQIVGLGHYLKVKKAERPFRFLRIVTGKNEAGYTGEVYDADGNFLAKIDEIRVIGKTGIQHLKCFRESAVFPPGIKGSQRYSQIWRMDERAEKQDRLSTEERKRLDRNINWLGEAGQANITETHIALCGLGGLGIEVLKNCRGLGFKRFTLIDMDRLETSNLNRFLCSAEEVGDYKVDIAERFIKAVVPDAEVTVFREPVDAEGPQCALRSVDIIVNALDDDIARHSVQVVAARHLIPMLDLGSGIRLKAPSRKVESMGGQAIFYVPDGPCLLCQGLNLSHSVPREIRLLHRQIGYVEGTDETPASVVTINSMMGGIAADLLMKYLSGFSVASRYVSYDMLRHELRVLNCKKRKQCPVCGPEGCEGRGENFVEPLKCPVSVEDYFASKSSDEEKSKEDVSSCIKGANTAEVINEQKKSEISAETRISAPVSDQLVLAACTQRGERGEDLLSAQGKEDVFVGEP
ncbi:MAG: ThiF family adenylyltransferase [Candidatus Hydrogenedens sp.]|nr:ThiF family adenylyltransferase [Candidatus Hydrogenedens sp.]